MGLVFGSFKHGFIGLPCCGGGEGGVSGGPNAAENLSLVVDTYCMMNSVIGHFNLVAGTFSDGKPRERGSRVSGGQNAADNLYGC